MKTLRISPLSVATATLLLASSPFLSAQPYNTFPPPERNPRVVPNQEALVWEREAPPAVRGRLHRFSPEAESFGMVRMAGRPVRGVRGEELSTITDFLIDPQSGRVEFAILPSGGGPRGMTYRIIPISAFTGADENGLTIRLDHGQWDRVGTLEEAQLRDVVTIDIDHQQRLSRQLGLPVKEIYDGVGDAHLVRASSLRGQEIRADNRAVGRIEDVVVDVTRHEAAIVISTDQAFAGASQRYVVPFRQIGTRERGVWVSHLNRNDFADSDRAWRPDEGQRGNRAAYNSAPPPTAYPNGYPAGYPTGRMNETEYASSAIRESLDHSWARGRVNVVPDRSRIVLQGLVDTERERDDIQRLAERSAPGVRIENQIAVRQR